MESEKSSSIGLTVLKGVGLIIGGAALGFFGCMGGMDADSVALGVVAFILGSAAIAFGAGMMLLAFAKGLMGRTKRKE
jgi:hypothetical protein